MGTLIVSVHACCPDLGRRGAVFANASWNKGDTVWLLVGMPLVLLGREHFYQEHQIRIASETNSKDSRPVANPVVWDHQRWQLRLWQWMSTLQKV